MEQSQETDRQKELRRKIVEIQKDSSLDPATKAKKIQVNRMRNLIAMTKIRSYIFLEIRLNEQFCGKIISKNYQILFTTY
jgi:hypothetical protein